MWPVVCRTVRDPFPRRTATATRLLPWAGELARTLPGLLDAFARRDVLNPRTRERVIMAVTEVNGCRYCAWIHGSWQDFLGDVPAANAEDALLTYARACADAGTPLDPAPLRDVLPAESVRAVRATVAQIEIANLVGNTVDGLIARLTRKRPVDPVATVQELVAVGAAIPVALPMLGIGALLRAVEQAAPDVTIGEQPPAGEANLLVHVLSEVLPQLLANAALRLAVMRLPVRFALGVRAHSAAATLRVGRGRIDLANGIAPDVLAVIEGEVGPLLRLATGAVLEEFRNVRLRPGSSAP